MLSLLDLKSEIQKVDELIKESLSSNSDYINEIISKSFIFKGKKLRPVTIMLGYNIINNTNTLPEKLFKLAAGVEILHCATLIHDDINDKNDMRRGFPTINSQYGNTIAQIIGDLFYVKSFELCAEFSEDIIKMTARCCSDIAEGEIIQFQNMDNVDISKDLILKISELKTASLFSGSAYCGASLAGARDDEKDRLYNFGKYFGLAFQLMDDILDYRSNTSILGKNIHQDLDEGKITLPLYYALNDSSVENKAELFSMLKGMPKIERKVELEKLFDDTGAIEKTNEQIRYYCDLAKKELTGFENKENLETLIDMLISQNYK